MAVGLEPPSQLASIAGIKLSVVAAGIKYENRNDLVLMTLAAESVTAAVFTQNAFCAAPVMLAKKHLSENQPRCFIINSGNANAGTGQSGLDDALAICQYVAKLNQCHESQVLPFSTGVIGESLPVEKIKLGLEQQPEKLSEKRWFEAAHAIMTTDTVAKAISKTINLDGEEITITGMAKGAGMIRPDMATMLAFIATDVRIDQALLQQCLEKNADLTFNRITVDGDTSTNDACILVATGQSAAPMIKNSNHPGYQLFQMAVHEVMHFLAQAIIRDGEGATKLLSIQVTGGKTEKECLDVAYTVAHSPLVKTAVFARDPNWGRIIAAVGRAGIDSLDIDAVTLHLGDVCIVEKGGRAQNYTEAAGVQAMSGDEIDIIIDLGRGYDKAEIWSCDLSYDYIKINAEYRT